MFKNIHTYSVLLVYRSHTLYGCVRDRCYCNMLYNYSSSLVGCSYNMILRSWCERTPVCMDESHLGKRTLFYHAIQGYVGLHLSQNKILYMCTIVSLMTLLCWQSLEFVLGLMAVATPNKVTIFLAKTKQWMFTLVSAS